MPKREEEFSANDLQEILKDSEPGERIQHLFEVNNKGVGESVRVIVSGGTIFNIFMSSPDTFVVQEIKFVPQFGSTRRLNGIHQTENFLDSFGSWEEFAPESFTKKD